MTPIPSLNGSDQRTYNAIFQHPLAHNLQWHDVHALLRHFATVTEEPNGNLKALRHGETLVLRQPRTKDVAESDELMALRHFLERSEAAAAGPAAEEHWLLVIDHHAARIFRTVLRGTSPERIHPHKPEDFFRHEQNSQNLSRGKEKPDPNSFFEPVARALEAAGPVLIFGTGTGHSSEMDQFAAWVKIHHPGLAARIIGTQVIDEQHLTEPQLLAHARTFYAAQPATRA